MKSTAVRTKNLLIPVAVAVAVAVALSAASAMAHKPPTAPSIAPDAVLTWNTYAVNAVRGRRRRDSRSRA